MMERLEPDEVIYFIVHCSATAPAADIGVNEIDRWHRRRGWDMVGYHFVIRRSGILEVGRDTHHQGAHAKGFNDVSLGICLVGGVDERSDPVFNFNSIQMNTMQSLIDRLHMVFPSAIVIGHRDVPSEHPVTKACPSFDIQRFFALGGHK